MPKIKVVRSQGGAIINIGEWNYGLEWVAVLHPETEQEIFDLLPAGGFVKRTRQIFTNPLPDGAYEDEAEIVTGWDGGLYEAADPRRLGPSSS